MATLRIPARAAIAGVGIALAAVPLLKLPAFYESFLYLVFHWIVLATSWNILSGYSGYFSFGHGAFFGVGMYTTATLAGQFGMPFLWTLPVAALVAAAFGIGIGAVVFRVGRLRGELFALITLAVTFVVATVVLNTPLDGGQGVNLGGVRLPSIMASPSSTLYVLALALAVLTVWIAYEIFHARLGTGLFAIHDDEDVAEVLGVPTFRYKLAALGVSCALAGVAGAIQAMFVSYVTVGETFSIIVPLNVVLMSVLGGTRHWLGPAVGATVITGLLYAFTAGEYAVAGRAAVGLILVVVILFLPDGVLGRFVRGARSRASRSARAAELPLPASPPAPVASRPAAPGTATRGADAPGGPLLEVRGVAKSFRGVRALDGVDIDVRRGEILGLVGPNGSGKSTLINVVSGHYRNDGGRIAFDGRDLTGAPAHRIARAGIARTYQIPRPFAHLSVLDNVVLPAMFGRDSLERGAAEREALTWLEFTGLATKADDLPDALNLHQRKFLELARALASRPQLLLLDEVLSGLTPSEIDGAIRTIRAIRDRGATIVFVEHVMRAVMELTDRIVVLDQGRVIAEGAPADVMGRAEVVTAYLGRPHA
jgi:branched-chain amino acid transport system permease protein